ncbi:TonB family protein [Rhodospirillaceae bacterium SYSU D60014]|uniref:energy transducer TonB family protein n=1 Tax=Virgifigura deserti TaxID=2268457 RepID=UPI000E669C8E
MELRLHHWLAALTVAAAIHAGAVLLFHEPQAGAVSAGFGGVEVSLGPAGGAPGAEAVTEVSDAEIVEATEAPVVTPEVETVDAPPVETAQPVEFPPVETAEILPQETAVAEPEPVEPVQEVEVAEVEPVIEETTVQEVVEAPPPPPVKPKPPVTAQPRIEPAPVPPAAESPPTQTAALPEPTPPPGAGGKSGIQAEPGAGSGDGTAGGGLAGATTDYTAVLQAWLERHKEYPRRAQLRRQEGTVLLRFVMDRQGHVLSYRVERSSGHRALDREVEEMIERAQPLPAMPEEMQQAQLELVVPIQFFLR